MGKLEEIDWLHISQFGIRTLLRHREKGYGILKKKQQNNRFELVIVMSAHTLLMVFLYYQNVSTFEEFITTFKGGANSRGTHSRPLHALLIPSIMPYNIQYLKTHSLHMVLV